MLHEKKARKFSNKQSSYCRHNLEILKIKETPKLINFIVKFAILDSIWCGILNLFQKIFFDDFIVF